MKTIAFIFVPVYIERTSGAAFQAKPGREVEKVRRILFSHPRHHQPLWTWFMDNPRSSSLHPQ
jgi:hypothetical protein